MAVKLPSINITFRELADTFIRRSERGLALLIIRDATGGGNRYDRYDTPAQLQEAPYSDANKQYILDAMSFGPWKVGVAKIGKEQTVADGLSLITANETSGWITVVDGNSGDWSALVSWIKAQEAKGRTWKAVVYKADTPDSMQIVNLYNETVTYADDRGQKDGGTFTPGLCGLIAACSVIRSATGMVCPMLNTVAVPADPDGAVAKGQMLLVIDEEHLVRVAVDVNSLTTLNGTTATEDMQYIETVEALTLIRDDISKAFRATYRGQYRNSLNNQMLLIAAINEYLRQLTEPGIAVLDEAHRNLATIDTAAQRQAWVRAGQQDAQDWDDARVRSTPYKRDVFLAGNIKILGSMTNLQWLVTLM